MTYKFEDYNELIIRFDGDEDREMSLRFGEKSNWTVSFRGEKYYCGDTEQYDTKEFDLKKLFIYIYDREKFYRNAEKDAKDKLENDFKRKNLKLISDNKRMKEDLKRISVMVSKLKEENKTLKDAIQLVKK